MTDAYPIQKLLAAIRDDATSDSLLAADKTLLAAIEGCNEPRLIGQLILGYYRDLDRANRTPRPFLYLHIGMLTGAIERLDELVQAVGPKVCEVALRARTRREGARNE